MRVLVVTPHSPYPAAGGLALRMLNLLKQAGTEHQVTLASLADEPPSADTTAALSALVNEIAFFPRPRLSAAFAVPAVASVFGGRPLTVARYFSSELAEFLRKADTTGDYDLVHYHTVHLGQYAPLTRQTPALLDAPDVASELWRLGRDTKRNPLMRLAVHTQFRAMVAYERWVYRQVELVTAVSEDDRQQIAAGGAGARARLVPNGVDTDFNQPVEAAPEPHTMVFVGDMRWPPNRDAASWFCRSVLPHICQRFPEAKLYLVGNAPGPALQRLVGPAVVVTGTVPDVRPFVARAAISVVPLRVAGGTRLKILEAMALGRPVVSTTLGAQGLGATDGENIMVADTPQAFADAVGQLFCSEQRQADLAQAGRAFAVERFDWRVIGRQLLSVYRELAESKHRGPGRGES